MNVTKISRNFSRYQHFWQKILGPGMDGSRWQPSVAPSLSRYQQKWAKMLGHGLDAGADARVTSTSTSSATAGLDAESAEETLNVSIFEKNYRYG